MTEQLPFDMMPQTLVFDDVEIDTHRAFIHTNTEYIVQYIDGTHSESWLYDNSEEAYAKYDELDAQGKDVELTVQVNYKQE